HDLGKYQIEFQERLAGKNIKVDHSTCGAKYIYEKNNHNVNSLLMAYCIAGHHRGLPDGGSLVSSDDATLYARLKSKFPEIDFSKEKLNIKNIEELKIAGAPKNKAEFFNFLSFKTRFMFSCLVDADYLDTEKFCAEKERKKQFDSLDVLLDKINEKYEKFENSSKINFARENLKNIALKSLSGNQKISFLDLPTGSGKTLLSMKIALEKAIKEGKKRIIYVIPYTSITSQNAKVFKDIFGENNVLEHHSNYEFQDTENDEILKESSENWDAPIIMTTNVQFFESIYSNRSSRMRKLHNMANAIICFDEAHTIPLKLFDACIEAILYIAENCNSDIILMSATMVDYKKLNARFDTANELVVDKSLYSEFARCDVVNLCDKSEDEMIENLRKDRSNLIVVNTKNTAKKLFEKINAQNKVLLTTNLTLYDRQCIIEKIEKALKQKEAIVVVSTSLIEAGVDLDFDCVYREINGVDSIVQCMGRCNREGKKEDCHTYIFVTDDTSKIQNNDTKLKISITKTLLEQYLDISSKECIERYNELLYYANKESLSAYNFGQDDECVCFSNGFISLPFEEFAEKFKYIDTNTTNIVILNDMTKSLIENFEFCNSIEVRRKLAKHSVSVYQNAFLKLKSANALSQVGDIYYLN
ncbi:MAG: CRISPR-associated helicase Cas3', partial [Clostridia bacterium]